MKPGEVQRDAQPGVTTLMPEEIPKLGVVAKIRDFGRPLREAPRWLIIGWSIGIAVLSLVTLVMAFVIWLRPILHRKADTSEKDGMAADAHVRVPSLFRSPSQEEALTLVKKALALRNPEAVDGLIRAGSLTPQEVVMYLQAMKTVDGDIADYSWLRSIDKNGLSLEGVMVTFVEKDKPKSRLAILTPDANGAWKMDFAAFARLVKPSWEDLLTNKTPLGMVRVYVAKYSYYNGPFLDDKKWAAYAMTSPDMEHTLVGYCKMGSAQRWAMEMIRQHGEYRPARATLEIRRVEGADQRQFEITRVLAEDWVLGEKPMDEDLR